MWHSHCTQSRGGTTLRVNSFMRRPDHRRWPLLTLTLFAVLAFGPACSGDPEARKQKYLASGDGYFDKGDYSTAIIEYRNAIAIDARLGKAHAKLAESYLRTGDPANALTAFARAADLLPDDFDVNLKTGVLLLAAGRPEDALGRAEAALKLRPQDVTAHVLRGNALAGLKSFDEALKAIEEAIHAALVPRSAASLPACRSTKSGNSTSAVTCW